MATLTTADSSSSSPSNHHSPRGSGFSGDGASSPQFRRKNLPSPWAQVVRGGDSESIAAVHQSPPSPPSSSSSPSPEQASFSDCSSLKKAAAAVTSSAQSSQPLEGSSDGKNGNAARPKKPAWKKPALNGVVEAVASPVMGADSWPALSAASNTKVSPKSSPPPSSSLADSSSISITDGSLPTSQGPVISSSPQRQVTCTTTSANPNTNHNRGGRQRFGKRGGGGNGNSSSSGGAPSQSVGFPHAPPQGSFPHAPPPPPPPPFPIFPMPPNGYAGMVPAVPDTPAREPPYRGNDWENRSAGVFVSQAHSQNDHRHSSRRGYNGPRGDGPGGRRDHDRRNHGNPRDVHMQPQRAPPRGFFRPPPSNASAFVPPQAVRPFGNPIGYPELLYVPTMPMEHFRGIPFMPPHSPPPAIIMPVPEPPLPALLVHQIEYYFSDTNLVKDEYLRSNMDPQGWVPISLIAGFPRVKSLTNNIPLILDSLRTSTTVETQDDKVRKRNEWMKWVPNTGLTTTESASPSAGGSTNDTVTTSVQKMTLEEAATDQNTMTGKTTPCSEDVTGSRSSELNNQTQLTKGRIMMARVQGQTDQATSTDN